MKQCYRCKIDKDLAEFASDKGKRDGLTTYCRDCIRIISLEKRFNISDEQYQQMLSDQDGRCKICGIVQDEKALAVDHDHNCCAGRFSCGKCIRGLLCSHCNLGISHFGDDPEKLRKAAEYLAQT